MLSCPDLTYCKRSLDFEMKETLKKRIVDIDIYIENFVIIVTSPSATRNRIYGRNMKTSNCPRKTGLSEKKNEWANK